MISSYFGLFRPLQDVKSRFILACGIALALAAGVPLPIIGVIFARIIDAFPPTEDEVKLRISQLIAVACAYFVVTWGWAICWGIVGAKVSRGLRIQMVDRALGLDQTYYETQCPDITTRLSTDAQAVQSGTAEKVGFFLQSVSYFVAAFVAGFILNPQLTGILLAAVIPTMSFVIYIGTATLDRFSKEAIENTTMAGVVAASAIKAVHVVQAFNAFDSLTADHERHLTRAMELGIKKAVTGAVLLGSVFFVAYGANALAFWQGFRILTSSHGNAGTVYAIIFLILDASFVIGQAGPFIQSFALAASAGSRILALIDYEDVPIDVYSDRGILADEDAFGSDKYIVFRDVSFSYPTRPVETILKRINLTVKTGTTVGIVGASGSGKSTIASLFYRFYDPSCGEISINGRTTPEYNLSTLRKHIALVDQDPAIFSSTVFANIRDGYKGPAIPEHEVRELCRQALKSVDAWKFIENLPNGLDTHLGRTKLSGGQMQRLCLARALVGDPSLLILDEATSALDMISEASVLSNLGQARSKEHKTTIMIAHRLASVRNCDKIIVMGKGRILEEGNHEYLMSIPDGAYRSLIEASKREPSDSHDKDPQMAIITDRNSLVLDDKPCDKFGSSKDSGELQSLSTISIIQRCFSLSRSRMWFTIAALLGSVITGSVILGESVIFGHLVQFLNGSGQPDQINFYCLMFFIIAIAAFIGYVTSGSCFGLVSEHLILRARDLSLRTILRQDIEWFHQPGCSPSTLTSVISMDSGYLSGLSGVIIGTIVSALVSVVGGAILAHIVAWKIAIVLFATSPIVVLAGFFRLQVLAKSEEKNQLAYTEAASLATEACSNIRTIAALGIEKQTSKRFQLALDKYQEQAFRDTALGSLLLAFSLAITYFVYALSYWWGAKQVRSGEYSSLQFFIVLPAILFSAQAAGQIFSLAPDIGRAKGAASRVFALHDQKPTIDKISDSPPTSTGQNASLQAQEKASTPKGNITFHNIHLTYASRPFSSVFTNLNLNIRAGETVALVGSSGAGKSSAISLIERFYDPTAGSILIDGVDIRYIPVSDHRSRISLVAQEPDQFSGSVAFNVGLGVKPGEVANRERIEEACRAVGIHEFVVGLPDGYETQCGVNGSNFSGGQKQRIAIARAYMRDPDILLLDEATSALDSHSEAQIQEAITAVSRKRTTIIVAHRLTSVQRADRILVFDDGRVVEEGRHEDLITNGGLYEQMVKAQNLG